MRKSGLETEKDLDRMYFRSVTCQLWRGVKEDLSSRYAKGEFQIWWQFSSCTSSLEILQQPQFIGQAGTRTLFSIEGATNGKDIRRHSYFQREAEILLLPGTYLEVYKVIQRSDGLHTIHVRQAKPPYELLVPPQFSGPLETNISPIRTFTVPQSNSSLTKTLPQRKYMDSDSSSEDELSKPENSTFLDRMDNHSSIGKNSCSSVAKVTYSSQPSMNGKSGNLQMMPKLQTQKSAKGLFSL
jgi:hypothetical protein